MSVLLTSAIYIDSVLTPVGTTVSLGYQREQQIVSAGEGTWVSTPTTPTPPATYPGFVSTTTNASGSTVLMGANGIKYPITNTYTWAQIQALTGMVAGDRVIASDVAYAEFIYNGTIWTRSTPLQLLGSGVPFIVGTSCSIGATGRITGLTAFNFASYPVNGYMWIGTNSNGLTANTWYYCVVDSSTTATLYNDTYSTGLPTIPASPTAFSGLTAAAYTSNPSAAISGPNISVPGGLLGLNGAIRFTSTQATNAAVTSFMGYGTNSNVLASGFLASGAEIGMTVREMRNRGVANAQVCRNPSAGNTWDQNGNASNAQLAIDSSIAQTAYFALQPGAATTWQVLESYTMEALLGA